MLKHKLKISVVISFWNEIDNLPELISRLRKVSKEAKEFELFEIIFVNDVSDDGSEKYLRNLATRDEDIVLLNMARRTGVSECVYAGMSEAKGEAVIYMDADLQDPPEIIPQMVKTYLENEDCEVVYTVRKSRDGESKFKLLFTKLGYKFLRRISNIDLPLDAGDFKLISRRILNIVLHHKEYKPFLRGIIASLGHSQLPVYYDREPRGNGRKKTKMTFLSSRTINYWLDSALISFSDVPLKITLFIGLGTAALSSFYLIIVFFQKILGLYVPGWPALMAAILFLGSVQLIVLGVLGLYISAIYSQTKNRPHFLIAEIVRK